ncbi:MAG: transglycosylase SLT domain-containing protein [Acidobacteria bacterium]|nr:transglycosylase SLT domain-containing protein [Acidobacteriota bacterium]
MQKRISTVLVGSAVLFGTCIPSQAEENRVLKLLNSKGTMVFTNIVDHVPPPVRPVIQEPTDRLAGEIPADIGALVERISANHEIDPALVRAVMKTESNFKRWAVSHKGAQGLMQLIPATARRFGVVDPFDAMQNIQGGVRYLKFLLEMFNGNLDLALAGYNAGENLVARLGRIPPINETTNYVKKVKALYRKPTPVLQSPVVMAAASATGAEPSKTEPRKEEDSRRIYTWVDSRGVTHFSNLGPPN